MKAALTVWDGRISPMFDVSRELLIVTSENGASFEPLHHELEKLGVEVIGFVAGEIDEVVDSFIQGALPSPALSMPGCNETQNRLCGGGVRTASRTHHAIMS